MAKNAIVLCGATAFSQIKRKSQQMNHRAPFTLCLKVKILSNYNR